MGFLSSIIDFVKGVVKSILNSIAKFMNAVFGSPIVAALAMFVIGFCLVGPASFSEFLSNPLLYISPIAAPIMFALTANVIITIVTAICPDLGKALGYVIGIISFVMTGFSLYALATKGSFAGAAVFATAFSTYLPALTIMELESIFLMVTVLSWTTLITSLASGVDDEGNFISPYAQGYVDGYFAVPEVVAEVADSALESVFSNLLPWVLVGFGAWYVLTKSKPAVVQIKGGAVGATS